MTIRIVHFEGARAGLVQEIPRAQVVLGRSPDCHVVFDRARDDMVSQEHAMLTVRGLEVIVSDLGSRNGTLVDGQRVGGPTVLKRSSVVQLGGGGPRILVEVVPDAAVVHGGPKDDAVSAASTSIRVACGAASEAGPRPDNQDAYFAEAPLFAVADGCGGHKGGEIASRLAIDTLRECVSDVRLAAHALSRAREPRAPTPSEHELAAYFRLANFRVRDRAHGDERFSGMGTTLTACWLRGTEVVVAHAGDTRLYVARGGTLEQVTDDDSYAQQLVRDGLIARSEAASHPQRNVIVRSIGMKPELEVSTRLLRPAAGDVLCLCSDGVHGPLDEREIARTLGDRRVAPAAAARDLVRQALARGGQDNATAVVVKIISLA